MLELKNIYKTYSSKNGVTHRALENVSLKFNDTGLTFILGKSGSGKSTLLNLIGGLDSFDRGDIIFNEQSFLAFSEKDYDYYRNSCVGFIFQDFKMIEALSVIENVRLALDLQSRKNDEKIISILKELEIYDIRNQKAGSLSGGQKQKIAIARALIKNPYIILADEPTGSLDSQTSKIIIKELKKLSKEHLVIIVTHNKELAYENGDRIIEIKDGFILKDLERNIDKDENKDKISIVSNSLVIIPKGKKIEDEQINKLNETIKEKRQDYYLLIEQNKNRVMSMYPNVKEVIDADNKDSFVPFKYTSDKNVNKHEHINSRLPFFKGLKIGLTSLGKKKLRLFFSTLLATLAVILSCSAANFTGYSLSKAVAMSIEHDNGRYLEVSSSFSLASSSYKLQNSEMNYLDSLNKDISYSYDRTLTYKYKTYSNKVDTQMKSDAIFNRSLSGFLVTDNIGKFGYKDNNFKIIASLDNISEDDYKNGIIISSFIAETIVKYSEYDTDIHYSNINEIVGINMRIDSFNYKVLGIYDIDEDESLYHYFYDNLGRSDVKKEFDAMCTSFFHKLIVTDSFMEEYKKSRNSLNAAFEITNYNGNITNSSIIRPVEQVDYTLSNTKVYYLDYTTNKFRYIDASEYYDILKTQSKDEIFVGYELFKQLFGRISNSNNETVASKVIEYNNLDTNVLNVTANDSSTLTNREVYQAFKDIKIIGVIMANTSVDTSLKDIYVNNDAYNLILDNMYLPNKALISMNKNDDYASTIANLYDNGFTINNEFVEYFNEFASIMEKYSTLINVVAIIWFIIVALLLYSFIANSIKENSETIGILKALGANKFDLYKIFIVEALIIGIVSCVFGVIIYYFGGLAINSIVTNLFYTFYFAIFIPNSANIIIMVLATMLILLVALIIPLSKISKIKPIDVMNSVN